MYVSVSSSAAHSNRTSRGPLPLGADASETEPRRRGVADDADCDELSRNESPGGYVYWRGRLRLQRRITGKRKGGG